MNSQEQGSKQPDPREQTVRARAAAETSAGAATRRSGSHRYPAAFLAICLASGVALSQIALAQQNGDARKDDIPDAPSATRPFPGPMPPPSSQRPANPPPSDTGTPPPNQAPPTEANPAAPADPNALPEPTYAPGVAPPPMNVKTVPAGGATDEGGCDQFLHVVSFRDSTCPPRLVWPQSVWGSSSASASVRATEERMTDECTRARGVRCFGSIDGRRGRRRRPRRGVGHGRRGVG